jgi:protein-S-isoprenylcysteine O-methyltransferase Ste14/putative flippase GtrA
VKIGAKREFLLALLAIVFTIGLVYASVELPRVVNAMLHDSFDFPTNDPVRQPELFERFILSHHLRLIGYGALGLLLILVVVGVLTEKRGLAATGAIGFFLPVFGHFCMSMFFLAGLGLLRTLWMPITDVSFDLLRLGEIVYLPYAIIVYVPALFGVDVRGPLPSIIMGIGILIFVLGVLAWFITRLQRRQTADFWVYRFSRHPQYLGWILWSYGLILYFVHYNEGTRFKLAWGFPDSLPFLLSAVVVIGVAMTEEIKMRREQTQEYEAYSQRTPFMLPVPRFVSNVAAFPMRLILKKERPETGKEVGVVLAVYTGLLILLSVPFVVFQWPPSSGWWGFPYNVYPFR